MRFINHSKTRNPRKRDFFEGSLLMCKWPRKDVSDDEVRSFSVILKRISGRLYRKGTNSQIYYIQNFLMYTQVDITSSIRIHNSGRVGSESWCSGGNGGISSDFCSCWVKRESVSKSSGTIPYIPISCIICSFDEEESRRWSKSTINSHIGSRSSIGSYFGDIREGGE